MSHIRTEYFDQETEQIIRNNLSETDMKYIKDFNISINMKELLFERWTTLLLSMDSKYLLEYYNLRYQNLRNLWLKKYLEYSTHNMSLMPPTLLPFEVE